MNVLCQWNGTVVVSFGEVTSLQMTVAFSQAQVRAGSHVNEMLCRSELEAFRHF